MLSVPSSNIKDYLIVAKSTAIIPLALRTHLRSGSESSEVTVTIVSKVSSFGMKCVQCSDELIAPERSEYWSDKRICHVWHCLNCSCCFEALVLRPAETFNERHQVKGRYFLVAACRRQCLD